jgi:hypothetical protein
MFCLRAWVNDASHYLRGVRLSTGKKIASSKVWAEYRRHEFFLHSENTFKKNLSFSKQSFNGEVCNKLHAKHSNTT